MKLPQLKLRDLINESVKRPTPERLGCNTALNDLK